MIGVKKYHLAIKQQHTTGQSLQVELKEDQDVMLNVLILICL